MKKFDLETSCADKSPLAQRMRPRSVADLVGLDDIVQHGPVHAVLSGQVAPNLLFWGPPGCGKTTLARIIADSLNVPFTLMSAVEVGVADLRKILPGQKHRNKTASPSLFPGDVFVSQSSQLLFLDEIHHFNKSQQDILLKDLEDGNIFLIGATTENPSFNLNAALLSRLTVVTLPAAGEVVTMEVLKKALTSPQGINNGVQVDDPTLEQISTLAGGDLRNALTLLDQVCAAAHSQQKSTVDSQDITEMLKNNPMQYDRAGDAHYDAISAFIKSLRGSNADASLYWMAYMYEAGEDPLYLARRLVIFASEDIGNADPQAMTVALNAYQAYERLGRDQGWIPMAQAVTYLATAPKSNASYVAYKKAAATVRQKSRTTDVPWHLRNKPTKILKELAAKMDAEAYRYPHEEEFGFAAGVTYMPPAIVASQEEAWYQPVDRGFERTIRKRIEFFTQLEQERQGILRHTGLEDSND